MRGIATAIERLEQKVSINPDDAQPRYDLAVLLLDEHGRTQEPELLGRAQLHLARAIGEHPAHAAAHAALGYVYDLTEGGAEQALAQFREARRLEPRHREYDIYVITLLEATGREAEALAEIEAAARRHGVDLDALRRDLTAAGMATDAASLLLNGFIHARNFFASSLAEDAERIVNALMPGRARARAAAERARCAEDQRELRRTFDASCVPESLRALAKWASRYGVGDDYCRPLLLKRLSGPRRMALTRQVDANAQAIQAWLDSFAGAPMPPEAAAFMYLTLGVEEMREHS